MFYLNSPDGWESSVLHKYTYPDTFAVSVMCTSSEIHIATEKKITIQEPVTEIAVIRCYAGDAYFHRTNCRALYGEAFHIQTEVKAGTNVVYRLQQGEKLLAGLSVIQGNVHQNITVTPEIVKQLGLGCHNLILYASNMVTFPEVSADLQVCILEKIVGLQASVLKERDACFISPYITIGVSLDKGAPALLSFSLTGDKSSFSETRHMNGKRGIFRIAHQVQGSVQVKVRVWNAFSSLEVDVLASCNKESETERNGHNEHYLSFNKKMRKQHVRVVRDVWEIIAKPSDSVTTKQNIELSMRLPSTNTDIISYDWNSDKKGDCKPKSNTKTQTIQEDCLPDPFFYDKYVLTVNWRNSRNDNKSICITFTPTLYTSTDASLKCTEGCDPVEENKNAKIELRCSTSQCPKVDWYIEDPRDESKWNADTKDCYKNAGKIPLIKKQQDSSNYEVKYNSIETAKSQGQDVTVVAIYGTNKPFYLTYIIKTSSTTNNTASITRGPRTTQPQATKENTEISATNPSPGKTAATTTNASGSSKTTTTAGSFNKDTTTAATTKAPDGNVGGLSCTVSPSTGTVLDAFNLTCTPNVPCSNCQYCFSTKGKNLLCSESNEVKFIFLPLGKSSSNYSLLIMATAKNGSFEVNTTLTAQVRDSTANINSADLSAALDMLKKRGPLSGQAIGQLFTSVANNLNSQSAGSNTTERQLLRKMMLDTMIDTINKAPSNTPEEAQVVANTLSTIVQRGTELSLSAQVDASTLFASLTSSLLHMNLSQTQDNKNEMLSTVSALLEGVANMLNYSSNKNVSDALLGALNNIQSALLNYKETNEGPTVISQSIISILVNRVTPDRLHTDSISVANSSSPTFSLPELPSDMFPAGEPVDVRMLSLDKNPFSWNEGGNISGTIGALSLTAKNGSGIPVENLSEDIEVLLPRPSEQQVNTSVLDLGNFSTTVIVVPSADTTLVLKMVPSVDPLPFKVFLGYMDYPTETNYVAMTQMPQQGATQEERYTWLLDPKNLKGNTGVHYLVVRPIVGPGIKSINASLSITPITSSCKFWNESQLQWSDSGCKVGINTTKLVTQCLCNHLTFFGGSFFVTPNLVDPSRTAELFATFAENPVVVCFVGALFVSYLLVVVWARRKDIQDKVKVKVTDLEDNDPMDKYRYLLSVSTGHRIGASTSSQVVITLLGAKGNSEPHHLTDPKKCLFERGAVDIFLLTTPFSLGELQGIRLWHNNSGSHPSWFVGNVMVQDLQTQQKWHFLCNSWLAIDIGDCCLDKVFPVSTEMDLKRFSNLFFMKTAKDFSDGHLWYSVINRPPSSNFTCVQRVSCCFSLLLCTMLTSIMFYGIPTDPSEQVMELGHFQFTWQQFMVGVQSSLIMFPVNIFIVSIFRNTRPRETSCCQRKTKKKKTLKGKSTLQTGCPQTTTKTNKNVNVTLDIIIKDIKRIASLLPKTSTIPCTESEFKPGQEKDINAILSEVEDRVKKENRSNNAQSKIQHQPADSSVCLHPASAEKAIKMNINKTHLYKQLCHIEKEMKLLGPSSFPSPHNYCQALQQVQGMKSFLEDQLLPTSCIKLDEPTDENCSSSPVDGPVSDGGQKKRRCCTGMLPWWFIFVGWLMVIATSVVSGYFTMLYGLKFGKERSISWLVSMNVSFFQSLLLIQPLKVIFLAVFFALVIKKVDEEDSQNVELVTDNRNEGDCKDFCISREEGRLYEPPPPEDVERMKRNKITQQKAFALLREIFTYMGFMWMLLLVAYGQRDPNAFFLNQHITQSFSQGVSDSMSLQDVFTWASNTLLTNLFGNYPGFITDGNSKLVGNARLRQLRVQNNSCQIADSMLALAPDCQAPYSWDVEDMGSYETGWTRALNGNVSGSASSPWKYQMQAQLRAQPIWGQLALYRGGGFVVELGPDLPNASSTLVNLYNNKWLDKYTRAIFIEFTVYNANVNLFCIVTLLMETSAVGAFQFNSELLSIRLYQTTDGLHFLIMAAEIVYMIFILYYMFLQGKLLKQQRWLYFRNKWNLLELSIILLSWSAVALFIKRALLGNNDMTYYQNHKDQFVSFYDTAMADLLLQYLIAFLILLSTVKLWHLLRLNPKINMMTAALQRAWNDISSFLVIIAIVFVAYSIASNMIYGWEISSYKTFADSFLTIVGLQIGIFNYDEVLDSNPLLGGLLFGSCIVFMTFVLLNLFVSVILVALNEEQKHHKPSEEEQIVDVMLTNICNLFGIRYNGEKGT
ncbi:polycystic kidney disease protein 1-like 2 [Melanotaenia boesemani]|uniref:polycystic kidney disease protein 1-like 2 n=1 Tax=Melanotaenia boesemani TaxID=1250792 RepID=UPI001C05B7CE|nr:polycystic kidney disease protein 1-like 2 [Melanotaenia boesemani]